MRRLLAVVGAAALVAGCASGLGRDDPDCDVVAPNSVVIQAQSVPGTRFVPCIEALPAVWEYGSVSARNGRSEFHLQSPLLGWPFLTVVLEKSCDVDRAVQVPSDEAETELFVDVVEDTATRIVVIPEGGARNIAFRADQIAADLDGRLLEGRRVEANVLRGPEPTADRIARARDSGAHLLIVGARDLEEGTVTLLLTGASEQPATEIEQALVSIEDRSPPPRYAGTWYYRFEGGCVTYRFNAEGPSALTVGDDVSASLSLYDIDELRDLIADDDYVVP